MHPALDPTRRPSPDLGAIRRRHERDASLLVNPPEVGKPLTVALARVIDEALVDRMCLLKAAERTRP